MEKLSFTETTKNELLSLYPEDAKSERAWLSAAIRTSAAIVIERKNAVLKFESENSKLIETVLEIVKSLYKAPVEASREVVKSGPKKGQERWSLKVSAGQTREILLDACVMTEVGGIYNSFASGIDPSLVETTSAAKNFVKALYIGCGNVSVPKPTADAEDETKSAGYHLEFILSQQNLAADLVRLLAELEIDARYMERKDSHIVYIKDREVLSNFFAALGAGDSVLYIQEVIIERELMNRMNREANFSAANIDKTMKASAKQSVAIEVIDEKIGLDNLPEPLREVAFLRRANPTATFQELQAMLPYIGKSGLNHRLRKIVKIAQELQDSDGSSYDEND